MVKKILIQYWREITIAILVILVAISVQTCHSSVVAKNEEMAIIANSKDSSYLVASKHVLKNGQLAYQVKTQEVTIDQLKTNQDALGLNIKDLKGQVGNLNGLVAYWKGRASMKDTIKTTLRDTVYLDRGIKKNGKEFAWNNKYMQMSGFIPQDEGSIDIGYIYDVDFTFTAYRNGKTLFKPGQLVADITFSDPDVKVGAFRGVVIKEKPKKFYETTLFKLGLGIGLGVKVAQMLSK